MAAVAPEETIGKVAVLPSAFVGLRALSLIRPQFLDEDIVEELYQNLFLVSNVFLSLTFAPLIYSSIKSSEPVATSTTRTHYCTLDVALRYAILATKRNS